MLDKIFIKNVALIESAEITFTEGLNVLSGETGAGKSVIMESLNFVLGAKADRSLIKSGETECYVSAEFDIEKEPAVKAVLSEMDIEDDDLLIISRKMSESGKSVVKINGVSATVGMLKKLTGVLVDLHGQSEHFALLDNSNQLKLIDKFGGDELSEIKSAVKTSYEELSSLKKQLDSFGGDEKDRLIRLDILNYQINEIKSLNVGENEFSELSALKEKLMNREKILSALSTVKACVSEESGALDTLSAAIRAIGQISDINDNYRSLFERLNAAYSELDDISDTAEGYKEDFDDYGYTLEGVEDRLYRIKTLFKKYGGDYDALTAFLEDAEKEREKIENFNENADKINAKIDDSKKELYSLYLKLSETRKKSAEKFSSLIIDELKELGMKKAQFTVEFSEIPDFSQCEFNSANGIDGVTFMFSANLGEPVKPLSEIISGGEISRFMLAIKSQTAKYNEISTFIFDEIDSGISGVIAKTVAEKFAVISKSVQIIAISHLAQIISFADNNILIYKTESKERTFTNVKRLNKEEKISEIIRILGGDDNSAAAKEHAKMLIDSAEKYKLAT